MQRDDIPAIGRLFLKAFRHRLGESTAEFNRYFEQLFFECPHYDVRYGGVVHLDETGYLDAAIASIPIPMMASGRVIMARLMCAFMSDPASRSDGAVRLALTSRPKLQEFAFSDTASETSAGFTSAVGGCVLPTQSQEWRYVFRPLTHRVRAAERRWPRLARFRFSSLTPLADGVASLFWRRGAAIGKGLRVEPLSDDGFLEAAPRLIAHFAVHPVWSAAELGWVLTMARQKTAAGPLTLRAVRQADGALIGCFIYYGARRGVASVLNVFVLPGQETAVVAAMTDHLRRAGHSSASGMAQPFLQDAMDAYAGFTFRKRSFFCVSSKHADICKTIEGGDFFIGGLASESWSRLLTDFN